MTRTFNDLVASLWCLHWPGARLSTATITPFRSSGVFLDTCLRQLAFGLAPRPSLTADPAGELSTGPQAYRLLLEVASGLRSAVAGETNVFGQFRRASEQAAALLGPEDWHRLQPIIQAVHADTRALRTGHLQGLGGSSYGSLVRALLAPQPDARVLFVGTGELTRSMLPLFRAFEVGVWNHRRGAPLTDVCRWFSPDEADTAAGWATDIVFTTPRNPDHDSAWCERLRPRTLRGFVHLGQRRGTGLHWASGVAGFDLDDVFDLASVRDLNRSRQLTEAGLACSALVEARLEDARPLRFPAGLARLRA